MSETQVETCPKCGAQSRWDAPEGAINQIIFLCPCGHRWEVQPLRAAPSPGSIGTEQPMPKPGGESVTDRLVERLRERQAKGIATYGRSLETFNGRDAHRDLEEELLDALQYNAQQRMERVALEERLAAAQKQIMALSGALTRSRLERWCFTEREADILLAALRCFKASPPAQLEVAAIKQRFETNDRKGKP